MSVIQAQSLQGVKQFATTQNSGVVWEIWIECRPLRGGHLTGFGDYGNICEHLNTYRSDSGKDFQHRRQWIKDRMQFLAGQFGVDVLGFAVLSNHLHVVLRNRPDVVQGWSDLEVARRWWNTFPKRRDRDQPVHFGV